MHGQHEEAETTTRTGISEAVVRHVLSNRLGMIPDPAGGEPWLSLTAIANIINREPKTLMNWLYARRRAGLPIPSEHPARTYFRISEFAATMFDGRTPSGKGVR